MSTDAPPTSSDAATSASTTPGPATSNTATYHPGLDGLRALSVIAVVAYHAETVWASGGFLGVEVFFAISGFLITRLLADEWGREGRIDLRAFWLRRARRLLPALFGVLAGVVALSRFVPMSGAQHLRRDVAAALTYSTNIVQIVAGQSYFEQSNPGPLRHLWSLAIEEQFYLLWPLAVLGGLVLAARSVRTPAGDERHRAITDRLALLCLIAAACSYAWMAVVSYHHGDPSRAYYGTDTRAGGLLLGAFAALAVRDTTARWFNRAMDVAAVAAIGALGWLAHVVTDTDRFVYRGGFLLVDVCTLIAAIAVTRLPRTLVARALANPGLVWLGKRSYGLYLWHWPIFLVTRPGIDIAATGARSLVVRCTLVVAATELSYRVIEAPFRKGGARPSLRVLTGAAPFAAVAALSAALLAGAGFGSWRLAAAAPDTSATSIPTTEAPVAATTTVPGTTTTTTLPPLSAFRVLAIGDSVMAGAKPRLVPELGSTLVLDAKASRQWSAALHAPDGVDGPILPTDIVILHLGQNGAASPKELGAVIDRFRPARRVLVLTVHVHRRWQGTVNRQIEGLAAASPNVVVVDWDATAEGHRDWFVRDGVHLTSAGITAYVALIRASLSDLVAFPPPTTTTTTVASTTTTTTTTTTTGPAPTTTAASAATPAG